jgi:hypothetical protein
MVLGIGVPDTVPLLLHFNTKPSWLEFYAHSFH